MLWKKFYHHLPNVVTLVEYTLSCYLYNQWLLESISLYSGECDLQNFFIRTTETKRMSLFYYMTYFIFLSYACHLPSVVHETIRILT